MMRPSAGSTDAGAAAAALPLLGRRVQISGSANGRTDPALIRYGHELVRHLVRGVMSAGGGVVVGIGREPRQDGAAADAPSLLFDWTALEAAGECLKTGVSSLAYKVWPADCCHLFREGGVRDTGMPSGFV